MDKTYYNSRFNVEFMGPSLKAIHTFIVPTYVHLRISNSIVNLSAIFFKNHAEICPIVLFHKFNTI